MDKCQVVNAADMSAVGGAGGGKTAGGVVPPQNKSASSASVTAAGSGTSIPPASTSVPAAPAAPQTNNHPNQNHLATATTAYKTSREMDELFSQLDGEYTAADRHLRSRVRQQEDDDATRQLGKLSQMLLGEDVLGGDLSPKGEGGLGERLPSVPSAAGTSVSLSASATAPAPAPAPAPARAQVSVSDSSGSGVGGIRIVNTLPGTHCTCTEAPSAETDTAAVPPATAVVVVSGLAGGLDWASVDIQVSPSALVVAFASSSGGGSGSGSGCGAGNVNGTEGGSGNVNDSTSGLSNQAQSVHVSGFTRPLNRESVQAKMSKKKGTLTLTVTLHYQ